MPGISPGRGRFERSLSGKEIVAEIAVVPDRPRIIATSSHGDGNHQLLEAAAEAICNEMDFDEVGFSVERVFA